MPTEEAEWVQGRSRLAESAWVVHHSTLLAFATYEDQDRLVKWQEQREPIFFGKPPLQLSGEDYKIVKLVCSSGPHKCQWLAAHVAVPPPPGDLGGPPVVVGSALYIAFRGTHEGMDALIDFAVSDVTTTQGTRMHSGVYSGIQSELPDLLSVVTEASQSEFRTRNVIFTGHSLGGCYATAALSETLSDPRWPAGVSAECLTFGMPLIFHAGSPGGSLRLPPALARNPPPMTHIVGNFDLVPRCFGWDEKTTAAVFAEIPKLTSGGGAAARIMGWMGVGMDRVATSMCRFGGYRAAGTYVFVTHDVKLPQSIGERESFSRPPGHLFRMGVSVVHPEPSHGMLNVAAEGVLRWLPLLCASSPVPEGVRCAGVEFLRWLPLDHGMATDYLPAIAALIREPESRRKWASALRSPKPSETALRARELQELLSGTQRVPQPPSPAVLKLYPDGGEEVLRLHARLQEIHTAAADTVKAARGRAEAELQLDPEPVSRRCCFCEETAIQYPVAMAPTQNRGEEMQWTAVAVLEPREATGDGAVRVQELNYKEPGAPGTPSAAIAVPSKALRPAVPPACGNPSSLVCSACWRRTVQCRRCPSTAPPGDPMDWLQRLCRSCRGGTSVGECMGQPPPDPPRRGTPSPPPGAEGGEGGGEAKAGGGVQVLNLSSNTVSVQMPLAFPTWTGGVDSGKATAVPGGARKGDVLRLVVGDAADRPEVREQVGEEGCQQIKDGVLKERELRVTEVDGEKVGRGRMCAASVGDWAAESAKRNGTASLTMITTAPPPPLYCPSVKLPAARGVLLNTDGRVQVVVFAECPLLGGVAWEALCQPVLPRKAADEPKKGWLGGIQTLMKTSMGTSSNWMGPQWGGGWMTEKKVQGIGELTLVNFLKRTWGGVEETMPSSRVLLLSLLNSIASEASLETGGRGWFGVGDTVGCGMPEENWVVDSAAPACPLCAKPFGVILRRHHCRGCGIVVCKECAKGSHHLFLHGDVTNSTAHPTGIAKEAVRVCRLCEKRLKEADPEPFGQYTARRCCPEGEVKLE
eukprot:Hpha_TRINITY_DN8453_c0_g1::TRINITY_DN8453_c0_g1_i1::g.34830::m.34830